MGRYNPLHELLVDARHRARCLTYKFNNLDPSTGTHDQLADARIKLLGEMLGRVGKGTFIEPPFNPDYGCNVIVGENCFANFGCVNPQASTYTLQHATTLSTLRSY
jgi:acetyltransferase-like isoleucine patch superfamily enzyme